MRSPSPAWFLSNISQSSGRAGNKEFQCSAAYIWHNFDPSASASMLRRHVRRYLNWLKVDVTLNQSNGLSHFSFPLTDAPATEMNDNASLSRATSISRASKQESTFSRNQSLIRKNIAPHDLKPSDVLIERFVSWKVIVKQLISYFEVHPSLCIFLPSR
jgi:hypothetical protein